MKEQGWEKFLKHLIMWGWVPIFMFVVSVDEYVDNQFYSWFEKLGMIVEDFGIWLQYI